ncbi:hypothetical protein [Anaerococcus tetradius]|uniref:Uncharacterized protein n=2 Tax=Anaerococcus tetradius TaxID=33036 RepID=C2CF30_9FIRM|nr:hypothetical protein [Anaerococcus tetradius]EEI83788.1 hypothetical protein HMPREF0077_0090 [Anaerococcus tetradius ATCC 35098]KWZ78834.1 hypothetical protein HMPREF3200_00529 [Anaerococcus tetradius]
MNLDTYSEELKSREKIYKFYISLAIIFIFIGEAFLKDKFAYNDFIFGFVYGLLIGMELFCFGKVIKINKARDDYSLLRQMYIEENDERQILIRLKSGYPILTNLSLAIFLFAILAGFINKAVFVTLLSVGVFQLLVSKAIRLYWRRKI